MFENKKKTTNNKNCSHNNKCWQLTYKHNDIKHSTPTFCFLFQTGAQSEVNQTNRLLKKNKTEHWQICFNFKFNSGCYPKANGWMNEWMNVQMDRQRQGTKW